MRSLPCRAIGRMLRWCMESAGAFCPPPPPSAAMSNGRVCPAVCSAAEEGGQSKSQREKIFSDMPLAPFTAAARNNHNKDTSSSCGSSCGSHNVNGSIKGSGKSSSNNSRN